MFINQFALFLIDQADQSVHLEHLLLREIWYFCYMKLLLARIINTLVGKNNFSTLKLLEDQGMIKNEIKTS